VTASLGSILPNPCCLFKFPASSLTQYLAGYRLRKLVNIRNVVNITFPYVPTMQFLTPVTCIMEVPAVTHEQYLEKYYF
jgi:hypothetical protein